MLVVKVTGDPKKATKVTKGIFKYYGFSVRNDYYSGGRSERELVTRGR